MNNQSLVGSVVIGAELSREGQFHPHNYNWEGGAGTI
jgi:hypothetical protein